MLTDCNPWSVVNGRRRAQWCCVPSGAGYGGVTAASTRWTEKVSERGRERTGMDRSLQSLGTMPNCRQVGFRHMGVAAVSFVLLLLAIGTGQSFWNLAPKCVRALIPQFSAIRFSPRLNPHDGNPWETVSADCWAFRVQGFESPLFPAWGRDHQRMFVFLGESSLCHPIS